jgi:hypothetical protein
MTIDQDEITAQVYQVIKNNQTLTKPQIMDKLIQSLPSVPLSRILISLNHLSEA